MKLKSLAKLFKPFNRGNIIEKRLKSIAYLKKRPTLASVVSSL